MTEAEWVASEDPAAMLAYLSVGSTVRHRSATDRKLRLFACACCRLVWPQLTDPRSRRGVEVAERYADGEATRAELNAARLEATRPPHDEAFASTMAWETCSAARDGTMTVVSSPSTVPPAVGAALLREVVGNPFRPVKLPEVRVGKPGRDGRLMAIMPEWWDHPAVLALARAAYETSQEVACGRCKGAGHLKAPRPISNPPCPNCHGTGRTSDGLLDPDRLAVLADALEEAGCESEELLRHLRGQERCLVCKANQPDESKPWDLCQFCESKGWQLLRGPHCRGCWCVDLILGRE